MKNYLLISVLTVLFISCKEKKKPAEEKEKPISAVSIIKGQLNHLDTSLYEVTRYERINDKTDTGLVQRGDIKTIAAPFLTLPEIANDSYDKNYTEERLIDAQQETLSIISTAKDENAEIQKQIIIINVSDISDGKVQSIYIDRYISSGDSTVEQKLFWNIDNFFSIGNIIQKKDQPERNNSIKVAWR